MKTLVAYVFHEYNNRVRYFIENAVFKHDNVDFLFILNNKSLLVDLPDYVKIFKRDNVGFDFGGWSDGVLTDNLYKNYDTFIFANSSIMGPYLPENYTGKWTDIFINGLTNNIKLFGPTINTCRDPLHKSHVQSYLFSMNLETLEFLISKGIFSSTVYPKNMYEAVWHREVPMSTVILKNGWNIGCLMKEYAGIDFTFKTQTPKIVYLDDIMNPKDIGWNNFSSYVFIKGNRFGM